MKRINKREPVFFTNFIRRNNPVEWNDIAEIRDNIRTYMLSGLVPDENISTHTKVFTCLYICNMLNDKIICKCVSNIK